MRYTPYTPYTLALRAVHRPYTPVHSQVPPLLLCTLRTLKDFECTAECTAECTVWRPICAWSVRKCTECTGLILGDTFGQGGCDG